ncbi:unnamed protein product [Macrosiphum euphorbiae]|uniref:Tc1-like transposase DDE domain-containing protein n=1 Tax=Macrosiphum euphorbiae TaxID=13131 RepID=A0AAV0XAF0_9HEMI|nr:unnamed protein product [Macrosiphum euphorbiae]
MSNNELEKNRYRKLAGTKGEVYEKPLNKVGLMNIVNRIKPQFNKYVIDEYVKSKNMVVLRLPPYHCELNPIELAWSSV